MSDRPRPASGRPQSSRTRRPQSSKATSSRPTSGKSMTNRPASAKNVSNRPASSRPTSANISAESLPYNQRAATYTNVTNSFQKLKVNRQHYWRQRRPSTERDDVKDTREPLLSGRSNVSGDSHKTNNSKNDAKVDEKNAKNSKPSTRTNRSSTYIRFKYPEHFHQRSVPNQSALERTIPECLRQFPRYTLLPTRQNCTHSPWGSVTYLRGHTVKSFGLRHPKDEGNERFKGPPPFARTPREIFEDGDKTVRTTTSADDEDRERNGQSQFVYEEPAKPTAYEVELYEEDFDEDAENGNVKSARKSYSDDSDDGDDSDDKSSVRSATNKLKTTKIDELLSDEEASIIDETVSKPSRAMAARRYSTGSEASECESDYGRNGLFD